MSAQDTLTFGPPHSQWVYHRSTKTYDLSRDRKYTLTVSTTKGPEETKIKMAAGLTALVVVDMQNFFLSDRVCCSIYKHQVPGNLRRGTEF
jgi:hypothetical protein